MSIASSWLPEFEAALADEYDHKPRIAALATLDGGSPRVRNVVCRRVDADGTVWVASDARSGKNAQLRGCPEAEVAFWLPRRRDQWRLAGTASILPAERALDLWRSMSESARALFDWPPPGAPRDPDPDADAFPTTPRPGPPPANFEAIGLSPLVVEHLDLNPHPHRRRRWEAADGWVERTLNP